MFLPIFGAKGRYATPQLPGLTVWGNADLAKGRYGALPSNNTPLTSYYDLSENGNTALSVTSPQNPTYKTNQVNTHASVGFDHASSNYLSVAHNSSLDITGGITMYVVFKVASIITFSSPFYKDVVGTDFTNGPYGFRINVANEMEASFQAADNSTVLVSTGVALTVGNSYVIEAYVDGATRQAFAKINNAAAIAGGILNTSLAVNASNLYIGSQKVGSLGNRTWDGDIPEYLLFNRTLTASERLPIRQYFGAKYNIPVN